MTRGVEQKKKKKGNILQEQMKKQKSTRGHFRNPLSYVSLWPPTTSPFTMLSPISFYFSGVHNVISAEDLTRSSSFIGSAGIMQNHRLSENLTLSIFSFFYSNFLLFLLHLLFFPGEVPLLCEWAQKATKKK